MSDTSGRTTSSRFWKRIKIFLGGSDPDYPKPEMAEGEAIVLEGVGARFKGLFGGAWGPVLITNRRVIWYQDTNTWPLPRVKGEVNLSDIVAVDKGSLMGFVFGGWKLRVHLRSGKVKTLYEGQGRLDEWIATIRRLIGGPQDS